MSQQVYTQTFDYLPDDLIWLYSQVGKKAKRNQTNYTEKESFTSFTLCFTLTYIDKVPFLGSVAWNRPMYDNFVRVVTRYCVNPDYINDWKAGSGCDNMRIDMVRHIDQQVDFCSKLEFQNFFISREDNNKHSNTNVHKRNLQGITDNINKYSKYNWSLSNEKQRVAPNPVTGWQWVIYNNEEYIKRNL